MKINVTGILIILAIVACAFVMMGNRPTQNVSRLNYANDPGETVSQEIEEKSDKPASKSNSNKTNTNKTTSTKSTNTKTNTTKTTSTNQKTTTNNNTSKTTVEKHYYYRNTKPDSASSDLVIPGGFPEVSSIYSELVSSSQPEESEASSSEQPSSQTPDPSSIPSSSISMPSSSSQPEPPVGTDFSRVYGKQQELIDLYLFDLVIPTSQPADEQQPGDFIDAQRALDMLSDLDQVLAYLGTDLFTGISAQGYTVHLNLLESEDGIGAPIDYTADGADLYFTIRNLKNAWQEKFMTGFYRACDYVIGQGQDLGLIYQPYGELNPSDFTYGKGNPQYVNSTPEKTYFFSFGAQANMEADRADLFYRYRIGAIPKEYLAEGCPIAEKVGYLEEVLLTYLCS